MEPFLNRLKKNIKKLKPLAMRQNLTAWRLYDKDVPEYVFIIDVYGTSVVVHHFAKYQEGEDVLLTPEEELLIVQELQKNGFEKITFRERVRKKRRTEQYERLQKKEDYQIVHENGLQFLVNISDYTDTGLFIDHRTTRSFVEKLAKDQKVLNLFCYTGSASCYAQKGGARHVTSVDLSQTYLNWAQKNQELNHLPPMTWIKADVLEWLKNTQETYDLIFCDPPSFSNSKSMDDYFDIQEHHSSLLALCSKILSPEGVILFSNNLRSFKMNPDLLNLYKIKNITKETIPFDIKDTFIHNAWILYTQKCPEIFEKIKLWEKS